MRVSLRRIPFSEGVSLNPGTCTMRVPVWAGVGGRLVSLVEPAIVPRKPVHSNRMQDRGQMGPDGTQELEDFPPGTPRIPHCAIMQKVCPQTRSDPPIASGRGTGLGVQNTIQLATRSDQPPTGVSRHRQSDVGPPGGGAAASTRRPSTRGASPTERTDNAALASGSGH